MLIVQMKKRGKTHRAASPCTYNQEPLISFPSIS